MFCVCVRPSARFLGVQLSVSFGYGSKLNHPRAPQVLVPVSIYQGNPFWGLPDFSQPPPCLNPALTTRRGSFRRAGSQAAAPFAASRPMLDHAPWAMGPEKVVRQRLRHTARDFRPPLTPARVNQK